MAAPKLLEQTTNQVLRGLKALFKRVETGHVGEHDAALFSRMENVFLELLDQAMQKRDDVVINDAKRDSNPAGNAGRPASIHISADSIDPIRIISDQ
jgi:hypothetical protein